MAENAEKPKIGGRVVILHKEPRVGDFAVYNHFIQSEFGFPRARRYIYTKNY